MLTRTDQQFRKMLDEVRKSLIDTGLRQNRLLHHNRQSKTKKHITLLATDVDATFGKLWDGKARIGFLDDPRATERERRRRDDDAEAAERDAEEILLLPAPRPAASPTMLQTRLGRNAMEDKLAKLKRDAKDIEEEQGVNTLFLAVGFLKWFEDTRSDKEREAPLILIPVQLHHDVRRGTVEMTAREDDLTINIVLQESLKALNVLLPEFPSDKSGDSEGWTPSAYFDLVQAAISSKPGWGIDREGIELGFFSFGKHLMYRDLDPAVWPNESIVTHPILRGLLTEGFGDEKAFVSDDVVLDDAYRPTDLFHVVDTDASQARVIESVRKGQNLVVQGPPGTGKSQTIANILAAAAQDGKRTLFVAEKVAALDVVKSRLEKVGLGPLCLEIHSKAANKTAVSQSIKATIDLQPEPVSVPDPNVLTQNRDWLNRATKELHAKVGDTGMSAYKALGILSRQSSDARSKQYAFTGALTWTPPQRDAILETAEGLSDVIAEMGPIAASPWAGVENMSLEPPSLSAVEELARDLYDRLNSIAQRLVGSFKAVGIQTPETYAEAEKIIRLALRIASNPSADLETLSVAGSITSQGAVTRMADALCTVIVKAKDGSSYTRVGLEANHATIIPVLARGAQSFFARWSPSYWKAVTELKTWTTTSVPKSPAERLAIAEGARTQAECRANVKAHDDRARKVFGNLWAGIDTDVDQLRWHGTAIDALIATGHDAGTMLALANQPHTSTKSFPELEEAVRQAQRVFDELMRILSANPEQMFGGASLADASLPLIANRLLAWTDNREAYYRYRRARDLTNTLANTYGLPDFCTDIITGELARQSIRPTFEKEVARFIWEKRASEAGPYLRATAQERDRAADTFRAAELEHIKTTPARILLNHIGRMPRGAQGQMAIIRGEAGKKRKLLAIRKLIAATGQTLQQIKPIWMMSPISVAAFVPPGAVEFDLLVIDEASQVRPEDAIGLIARSKQIVVLGDSKQLPPTSFFARALGDEGDNALEDDTTELTEALAFAPVNEMESILTLCDTRGLPSQMLRWHYRSRHPSLIRVSADAFYSDLIMPPSSVERGETGFIFRRVNGVYGRGTTRSNAIEAEEIAKALVAHAENTPHLSVGVATFSITQRQAVEAAIDHARRSSDALDAFIRDREGEEYLFVKSIEMVQGDERDVILVSVGYGPRLAGARLESMGFGPVQSEGGERRLNVLFTRARFRCEVFCSFDPEDINLDRAKSKGVALFKRYLIYARDGVLDSDHTAGDTFDSPFEEEVAAYIRSLGYEVDTQVGVSGFRIDLAVRDPNRPGRHMLAVEADGATYHSALWARERDRLRQTVLESMGWRFHRIWSTDWFYMGTSARMKLKDALDNARLNQSAQRPATVPTVAVARVVEQAPDTSAAAGTVAYEVCRVNMIDTRSRTPEERDARKVLQIVETEGPIHVEELARRYVSGHNGRATDRIIAEVERHIRDMPQLVGKPLFYEKPFIMTPEQRDSTPVRRRGDDKLPLTVSKAELLPHREIDAAILLAIANNGPMSVDELVKATVYVFGFKRAGGAIASAIRARVDVLIVGRRITVNGSTVTAI
jgi:very-short-patch-repair endonuclease